MADKLLLQVQALNPLTDRGVPNIVLADLSWAAFHLGAARIGGVLVEQLLSSVMDYESIQRLYHEGRDHVEVAAMSLGFGAVKTTLDLCADAVVNLAETQAQPRWFSTVDNLTDSVIRECRPATQAWITELRVHGELSILIFCRDAVIHRTPTRLIQAGTPGALAIRLPTGELTPPINELIPRFIAFGEHSLSTLCTAIASDYGSPPTEEETGK